MASCHPSCGAVLSNVFEWFPVSTTVGAYKVSDWNPSAFQRRAGVAPPGSAVESKAVSATGSLTYTALVEGEKYIAAAQVSGTWTYGPQFSAVTGSNGALYERTTNRDQPSGYASLDSSSRLPAAELPTVAELTTHKNAASGYAGLDANTKVPWSLLAGHVINVLDAEWGAKGDSNAAGTSGTADQAAINAAIDSLTSGGTVFIPRAPGGNGYRLTGPLVINRDDITLQCEGKGAELILAPNTNTTVIRGNSTADVAVAGAIRKSRCTIRDLYVEMNGPNQATDATGQTGAINLRGFSHVMLDNCYVHNAIDAAFDVRASWGVRISNCVADTVYFVGAGNGFNIGLTGNVNGSDASLINCRAIGVLDVGFWLGGSGASRMSASNCTVRGDWMTYRTDGAITSSSGTFTSATAGFTPDDVGKVIVINGAGAGGAALTTRIYAYTSATSVGLANVAATTVSGATFHWGSDDAPARKVFDLNTTASSATITSATAGFTSADVGKAVFIPAAGATAARIASVTNSTTALIVGTIASTLSNTTAIVGSSNSGVLSEGSVGRSNHLSINSCHVVGTINVGIGGSDANSGTNGSRHDQVTIGNSTVSDCYGTAVWCTGTQYALNGLHIDNCHGAALVLGDGNEFAEGPFTVSGGTIKMASDSTSNGLTIRKNGNLTNWLSNVTVNGLVVDGNGGGLRGIDLEGRIRAIDLLGCQIKGFKNSGLYMAATGSSSPTDVKVIGGDIRNNNQAGNAAGANSAGIACESAADGITISGVRVTDDQGSKTQTHALHWLSATRGTVTRNDFRGNATAAINAVFDSKTLYQDNRDVDDAYDGGVVLVGGTVTVSNTAVRNSGAGHWTPIDLSRFAAGGTHGALYIDAITTGTSFVIKSTSGTDTSSVFWRIR